MNLCYMSAKANAKALSKQLHVVEATIILIQIPSVRLYTRPQLKMTPQRGLAITANVVEFTTPALSNLFSVILSRRHASAWHIV